MNNGQNQLIFPRHDLNPLIPQVEQKFTDDEITIKDLNKLRTSLMESNQHQNINLVQIRSQQSSPVGLPISRLFSYYYTLPKCLQQKQFYFQTQFKYFKLFLTQNRQSCKRHKVKVNTNNRAIPKDFFNDFSSTNDQLSQQFKDYVQIYSSKHTQQIIDSTNQILQDGITKTAHFPRKIERSSQSSMAKFHAHDGRNLFIKQQCQTNQQKIKELDNNNQSNNFNHLKLEIQLPIKKTLPNLNGEINTDRIQLNLQKQESFDLSSQDISSTPKFVEKKQMFSSQQIGSLDNKISSNSQKILVEDQSQLNKLIKKRTMQLNQDINRNQSLQNNNSQQDKNPSECSYQQDENHKFKIFRKNDISISMNQIDQFRQKYNKNFIDIYKDKQTSEQITSNQKLEISQEDKSQNSTDESQRQIKSTSRINSQSNLNDNKNIKQSLVYKMIRKKIGSSEVDQPEDLQQLQQTNKSEKNILIKDKSSNDINKLANMITLTNEFIFNKNIVNDNVKSYNSNQNQIQNEKQNRDEQSLKQLEIESNNVLLKYKYDHNLKNVKDFINIDKENFISNMDQLNEISSSLFNNQFKQKQSSVHQQQKIQLNSLKIMNSCQRLNNDSKINIKSQKMNDLIIFDSNHNLQNIDSQMFKQEFNGINNNIKEIRSTTTSHLTQRQQLLYLQGELKKRNQLSFHESTNQQKNKLLNKNEISNYITDNINSQQQQQIAKDVNVIINEKQNLNQSFEKINECNYYSGRFYNKNFTNTPQNLNNNYSEVLPRLYPTRVKNIKSSQDRCQGKQQLQNQYVQQNIHPPLNKNFNFNKILNTNISSYQTTNGSQYNQTSLSDIYQFLPNNQEQFNSTSHQISTVQKHKSRTANSSPLSNQELNKQKQQQFVFKNKRKSQVIYNDKQLLNDLIKIEHNQL